MWIFLAININEERNFLSILFCLFSFCHTQCSLVLGFTGDFTCFGGTWGNLSLKEIWINTSIKMESHWLLRRTMLLSRDWLKLTNQPNWCKTKTGHHLVVWAFPRWTPATTRICYEYWLFCLPQLFWGLSFCFVLVKNAQTYPKSTWMHELLTAALP